MSTVTTTAYRTLPPFAFGHARDLRVRWAAREAGIAYNVELIDFDQRFSPANLVRHPFGLVPAIQTNEKDGLFDSGAILFALGLRSSALLPTDEAGRLETLSWMFSAANTIEPAALTLFAIDIVFADPGSALVLRDGMVTTIRNRLERLAEALANRDYLIGGFTVADVMMTGALRFLRHTTLVEEFPRVSAYLARCEARQAFQLALAEQEADYEVGLTDAGSTGAVSTLVRPTSASG